MKRGLRILLALTAALLMTASVCFAGDVPESLLGSVDAQVYFGEIKSVDDAGVTVIQRKNVKGAFEQDSEQTYAGTEFTESPEPGKTYLCGYLDENNPLYVWAVTSLDPLELEIEATDGMSERMQEYLNNGEFEQKERERLAALAEEPREEAPGVTPAEADKPAPDEEGTGVPALWIVSGLVLVALAVLLGKKVRR